MAISACLPAQHTGKTVLPRTAQQRGRQRHEKAIPKEQGCTPTHTQPIPQHPATGPRLSVLPYASDVLSRNGNQTLQSAKGEASKDHNLERTTLVAPSLNTQSIQYRSRRDLSLYVQ